MNITLEPISATEDKTNSLYASDDCQTLITMWQEYYPVIGYTLPWVGYFIKQQGQIVGSCSFNGKPLDNRVEVSYWTFKEHEGKGIGSMACKELVSIARNTKPDIVIVAKTAPEKNASTAILEKNGFAFTGVVQDHEIGDAWEWTNVNK